MRKLARTDSLSCAVLKPVSKLARTDSLSPDKAHREVNEEGAAVTVVKTLRGVDASRFVQQAKMPPHRPESRVKTLAREAAARVRTAFDPNLSEYTAARRRLGKSYSPVKAYTAEEAVRAGYLLPEASRVSMLDTAMSSAPTVEQADLLSLEEASAKIPTLGGPLPSDELERYKLLARVKAVEEDRPLLEETVKYGEET